MDASVPSTLMDIAKGMRGAVTDADRQHLAHILGMLGSDHAGERAAAGLQAEAFRKRHGLTWAELLALQPEETPPPPGPPPEPDLSSPLRPRYEPEQRKTDRLFLNAFTLAFALAVVILFHYLLPALL